MAGHPQASSRQHGPNDRLELPKNKDSNPASHRREDKFKPPMDPSRESSNASLGLRSPEPKKHLDRKPSPHGPFKSVSPGSALGTARTNNVCRTCRKLLRNIEKGQNRNSFKHYSNTRELKDSADTCQLCGLFRLSLRGSTTQSMGYWSGFGEQTPREQAILNSTQIQVEILDRFNPFSQQLPFRFLRPKSGQGGNTRVGKVVAISPEKSVSKCKQHSIVYNM
jgi:hypothetical protein